MKKVTFVHEGCVYETTTLKLAYWYKSWIKGESYQDALAKMPGYLITVLDFPVEITDCDDWEGTMQTLAELSDKTESQIITEWLESMRDNCEWDCDNEEEE